MPAEPPITANKVRRPIAMDFFSGAGGMSLGFEQAGFDVVAAVEYDPVHAAVHEFNFPLAEVLCADVSAVTAAELREAARGGLARHGRDVETWDGELDVVFGGPPCQGFSLIGRRLVDDRRNRLVFHFFRLIDELRPRYFVMENVPGMARGGHASILHQLVSEFRTIGYRFPPEGHRVLNAADFGVPQERRRLFLVGTRDGERIAMYPDPTVVPVAKRIADRQQQGRLDEIIPTGPTVRDAIGDLPDLDCFPDLSKMDEVRLPDEAVRAMSESASIYARRLMGLERDPGDSSRPRRWDRTYLTSSARTRHTPKSLERFENTKPGETEPISRFYRLDAEGLCNTLRAGTGSEGGAFTSPRPIHPWLPRVISVREAARLHSFPDWFRLHVTKWNGFRQIGNAVAPLVARAVGQSIVDQLGIRPWIPSEAVELGDRHLLTLTMQQAAAHFGADPTAIPAGRRRDWSRVGEWLFLRAWRPGATVVEFDDAAISDAFRGLKIRPPASWSSVPKLLASSGGLTSEVKVRAPAGACWQIEILADGKYAFVAVEESGASLELSERLAA